MPRKVPTLAVLVSLLALLCVALGGGARLAVAGADTASPAPSPSPSPSVSGSGSPSAAPSPSVSPTIAPASSATVAWAGRWARLAGRSRARVARLRRCLGRSAPRPLPRHPARSSGEAAWHVYGRSCRRSNGRWHAEAARDLRSVLHPRLVSAASWRPLLRYAGWPASVIPYALTIMRRESGGRPTALNPSGCAGLFQLAGCWWRGKFDPFDPLANVRCALAIWRREGWSPWVTAYDAP